MIEIKNCSKSYRSKFVVDDVTTDIPAGKITCIIGPNGAGKSTLLNMISRLTPLDSGEIKIDGKKIEDWDKAELAKTIATLKQENNTNVRLTVYELISFGRFPHSGGRLNAEDKRVIEEAIEYMNLSEFRDKYLDELSGGQRQRAYIAMTIAQNTKYILLDEPLNNLDMKSSVAMMKILDKLVKDLDKTIVIVMHDINFTSVYSDYILAMKNGKLKHMDKTQNVVVKEKLEKLYEMPFHIEEINKKIYVFTSRRRDEKDISFISSSCSDLCGSVFLLSIRR
ncbi:MAG: ABC transporter ATP-binding protein [Cetobacterium sp.]